METISIPTNNTAWAAELTNRSGWRGWDTAGNSVQEGVQNWSVKDEPYAVGVWGNVTETESIDWDAQVEVTQNVQWCIYEGDCVDPVKGGFDTAEEAMAAAEEMFPDRF